jgi:hypothetical protein
LSTSVKPRIAFIGVRISWLMLARKSLFARLAASASSFALRSSTLFSSSWVTSSKLISTPPGLPSPPATGEQLTLKVCSFAALSGRCSMQSRCTTFWRSAAAHGAASFASAEPSGASQPNSPACRPSNVSGGAPISDANAWLASTMVCFLSITSRPSASVSSAARTRPGTACDGSRWRSMRAR